jgi:hypothetical protein
MPFVPKIPAVALPVIGGLMVAAAVQAGEVSFASQLNQVRTADGAPVAVATASDAGDALVAASYDGNSPVLAASTSRTQYMRYRPRRSSRARYEEDYYRSPRNTSFVEFHGGFMDPDGEPDAFGLGGIKFGGLVDPHVAIGGLIDWGHRGVSDATVVSEIPGPGGGPPVTTTIELARSTVDFVPILAYLQFQGDNTKGMMPYAGIGGGYELLFLSAEDYATGETYDRTFGGWGWQAWAGLAIPLSRDAKLTAEVFRNGGNLSNEQDDPSTGYTIRETVNVDGTGGRFGLSFAF